MVSASASALVVVPSGGYVSISATDVLLQVTGDSPIRLYVGLTASNAPAASTTDYFVIDPPVQYKGDARQYPVNTIEIGLAANTTLWGMSDSDAHASAVRIIKK